MKKLLNGIDQYIAGIGLGIMVVITFGNVIGRYVLPVAWSFTEELVCGLFVLVTLLGAAAGARRGTHIGLSAVTDLLPGKYQKFVIVLQSLAIAFFSALLVYYSMLVVESEIRNNIRTVALNWPEALFGSFVTIGAVFMLIRSIQRCVRAFMPSPQNNPDDHKKAG